MRCPRSAVLVLVALLAVSVTGACGSDRAPRAAAGARRPPPANANEAGRVMVLAYHRVGGDLNFSPDYTISARRFRRELEYLHDHGYHPVDFHDLVAGRLDVPAGKTPVVLTFDDSSDSQFTFVRRGNRLVPDPGGAVGSLLDFHARHPDWPLRGTFFALPAADPPNNLFGQPRLATQKLRFLLDHGFELGLHTLWHADLASVTDREVVRQLALDVAELEKHTGRRDYPSLAVPFGVYPRNEALLRAGSYGGHSYRIDGVAEFPGGLARPPQMRGFDPYHVPRVPTGDDPGESRAAFRHFARHPADRYVSDGDPRTVTVPRRMEARLNREWLRRAGKVVRVRPAPPRQAARR